MKIEKKVLREKIQKKLKKNKYINNLEHFIYYN